MARKSFVRRWLPPLLTLTGLFAVIAVHQITSEPECADISIYGSRETDGMIGAGAPAHLFEKTLEETFSEYSVSVDGNPYPASQKSLDDYHASVEMGVNYAIKWVDFKVRECPDTSIILMGYSQGSHVTHEAIRRLDTYARGKDDLQHVDAVVLLGDPTRYLNDPHQTFLTIDGEAKRNGHYLETANAKPLLTPRRYAKRAFNICHVQDQVCNYDPTLKPEKIVSNPHFDPYTSRETQSEIVNLVKKNIDL